MNIEEMYRKMKLDEAAGSRSADSDVGDAKSPGKLKDQFTSQPGAAKLGSKVAGGDFSPEKLSADSKQSSEPGPADAGRASVKGKTMPSHDGDKIHEPNAENAGVSVSDVEGDKGEFDGKPKTVVSDMTKKDLGEKDLQEMGAPVSVSAINKFRKSPSSTPSAGKSALSGYAAANARAQAPKKTVGNLVKGAVNKVKSALNMGESSVEELYAKFISEYEAVLEENGINEYDEEEAIDFFVEQFGDLFEKSKEEADDEDDSDDSDEDEDSKEDNKEDKKEKSEKKEMDESMKFKLADQLGGLLESEGLTDEFKSQATTIFEAAVNAASKSHIESIQEQLQEQYETEVASYKEKLDEQVEKYLDYVVEEWVKQNKLAVESAARNNVAESFMARLKDLLEEHYVQLPEEKADLYESEVQRAEGLEAELNESIEAQRQLAEQVKQLNKKLQVESFVRDLSEVEAEKIRELSEGVEFQPEGFTAKLKTLKENFFPTRKSAGSMIVEDTPLVETAPVQRNAPVMDKYLSVLGKMESFSKK